MDTIRPWLGMEEEREPVPNQPPKTTPPTHNWATQEDEPEKEWQWKVPDLREGGEWFQARVTSLQEANQGLPNYKELYAAGLGSLAGHWRNYTEDGPTFLQFLWWEFPPKHHESLRVGCWMNFLIAPNGELKLNAEMDKGKRKAAGKFVDELEALGVLEEAKGELKANCALFCVDKGPKQPDKKRCIGDMKEGGHNGCIRKDPPFLVQLDNILPHLYPGGWTAIADASKYFHNYKTHPKEHLYLGCIHLVTNKHLVYLGLPMGSASLP